MQKQIYDPWHYLLLMLIFAKIEGKIKEKLNTNLKVLYVTNVFCNIHYDNNKKYLYHKLLHPTADWSILMFAASQKA